MFFCQSYSITNIAHNRRTDIYPSIFRVKGFLDRRTLDFTGKFDLHEAISLHCWYLISYGVVDKTALIYFFISYNIISTKHNCHTDISLQTLQTSTEMANPGIYTRVMAATSKFHASGKLPLLCDNEALDKSVGLWSLTDRCIQVSSSLDLQEVIAHDH